MKQTDLGSWMAYRLRGDEFTRVDAYFALGSIAHNTEHMRILADRWHEHDRDQYLIMAEKADSIDQHAKNRSEALIQALDQQTQHMEGMFSNLGAQLSNKLCDIHECIQSCEETMRTGFNATISAIERMHLNLAEILRTPRKTRALEAIAEAKKLMQNALNEPRFATSNFDHATKLLDEALRDSIGQTIAQAWLMRGWIEWKVRKQTKTSIVYFEQAMRVSNHGSLERVLATRHHCITQFENGVQTVELAHESLECYELSHNHSFMHNDIAVEMMKIANTVLRDATMLTKEANFLRNQSCQKAKQMIIRSPHLLNRLHDVTNDSIRTELLKCYRQLRDKARAECQKIIETTHPLIEASAVFFAHYKHSVKYIADKVRRLQFIASHILPEGLRAWKKEWNALQSLFKTELSLLFSQQQVLLDQKKAEVEKLQEQYRLDYARLAKKIDEDLIIYPCFLLGILGGWIGVTGASLVGLLVGFLGFFFASAFLLGLIASTYNEIVEKRAKHQAKQILDANLFKMKQTPEQLQKHMDLTKRFLSQWNNVANVDINIVKQLTSSLKHLL